VQSFLSGVTFKHAWSQTLKDAATSRFQLRPSASDFCNYVEFTLACLCMQYKLHEWSWELLTSDLLTLFNTILQTNRQMDGFTNKDTDAHNLTAIVPGNLCTDDYEITATWHLINYRSTVPFESITQLLNKKVPFVKTLRHRRNLANNAGGGGQNRPWGLGMKPSSQVRREILWWTSP
jgi:hypothetical protein